MVYRMQITYYEIMDISEMKYFPSKGTSFTLPPRTYETSDINKKLECLLPEIVKVNITIDDVRLGSELNIIKTLLIVKKLFLYSISLQY